MFKLAYGRDGMSDETRGTLLHSQLQEGLVRVEVAPRCHTLFLLQGKQDLKVSAGVQVEGTLVQPSQDGITEVVVVNCTGFTRCLEEGEVLGDAAPAEAVSAQDGDATRAFTVIAGPKSSTTISEQA